MFFKYLGGYTIKKYKLAIIGSGSLANIISKHIYEEMSDTYEILGFLVRNKEKARQLANSLNAKLYEDLDEVIEDRPDYIIEAASPDLVREIGVKILESGINLIPLSVGAFADKNFYEAAKNAALENKSRVHIPSGAVGGFDVLAASMLMGKAEVSIETEKAPESLNGAPYLKGRELSQDKKEEVFRGSAKEAIKGFPKNVNVAVATALATNGVEATRVSIDSLPDKKGNKHEIKLKGENIKISIAIESVPSPDNPKSSTLAAYSVIALLKRLVDPISF